VYIGRNQSQGGWNLKKSVFENKFPVKKYGLDEAIALYKKDLHVKIIMEPEVWIPRLLELRGKTLGCWCSPQKCHGDVLVDLVVRLDAALEAGNDAMDKFLDSLYE
jgi:hypothetical protein